MKFEISKVRVCATLGIFAFFNTSFSYGAVTKLSEKSFIYLEPEKTILWSTATNSTFSVPVDFPSSASSATLKVEGLRYLATYEILSEGDFRLSLPSVIDPATENVYKLTLSFDNGETRTARLGVIKSLIASNQGATRCLLPYDDRTWRKVNARAVFPLPYGYESLSLTTNGVETILEPDLVGTAHWCALPLTGTVNLSLSMPESSSDFYAYLKGLSGMVISVK